MLENKPFILNVYRSVSRERVENYLYALTYELIEGVVAVSYTHLFAGIAVGCQGCAKVIYKSGVLVLLFIWD